METLDANALLRVWERGALQGTVNRGLLLLSAALPGRAVEQLASLTIGERDSVLLSLREQLFGSRMECLTSCESCGETIELDLSVDGIRAGHGQAGVTHELEVDGFVVSFRLPDSSDLQHLERASGGGEPERMLLERCVLDVRARDAESALVPVIEPLPAAVVSAIDARMGEVDAQAQVQLAMTCPACRREFHAPFDVVGFLWTELERWSRALLREVHVLASAYGWTEPDVLALGHARRRFYLEQVSA